MEEKMVEELVEKWVVRVAGQEGGTAAFCCRWFSLLAGKRRKGKMKEREEERGVYI